MGKHKSVGKEKDKGSQLVIRIDKAERTAFVSLCEELDTSAAREIRRFMREFVASHAAKGASTVQLVTEAIASEPDMPAPDAADPAVVALKPAKPRQRSQPAKSAAKTPEA